MIHGAYRDKPLEMMFLKACYNYKAVIVQKKTAGCKVTSNKKCFVIK